MKQLHRNSLSYFGRQAARSCHHPCPVIHSKSRLSRIAKPQFSDQSVCLIPLCITMMRKGGKTPHRIVSKESTTLWKYACPIARSLNRRIPFIHHQYILFNVSLLRCNNPFLWKTPISQLSTSKNKSVEFRR